MFLAASPARFRWSCGLRRKAPLPSSHSEIAAFQQKYLEGSLSYFGKSLASDPVTLPIGKELYHELKGVRKEVEIVNKLGLHARPAAMFVRCVIRFKSTITIWKGKESFSAASLLEVLTANLDCGERVVLEAVGPDEQEALEELGALLLRFRNEEGEA